MPTHLASRRWPTRLAGTVVALTLALCGCTSVPDAPSSAGGATAPIEADGESGAPTAQVDALVIRAEAQPDGLQPYRRDAFGSGWSYDPSSGCNTRELVLIAESVVTPNVDDKCRSTAGSWTSAYDGVTTSDPADLQIDHLVPLSDAWRSGAASWSDERRETFANDLTDPATLIAVTGHTNQSKGDSSPDQWLPPDRTAWCGYATDWVSVKARWGLSVSAAEKSALVQILGGC